MSQYHFGYDYDMWLYPQPALDADYWELPEHIECVNIEGQLFVDVEDAIEQVRKLQKTCDDFRKFTRQALEEYVSEHEDNVKLRDLANCMYHHYVAGDVTPCELCDLMLDCENHPAMSCKYGEDGFPADAYFEKQMRDLGIEVE